MFEVGERVIAVISISVTGQINNYFLVISLQTIRHLRQVATQAHSSVRSNNTRNDVTIACSNKCSGDSLYIQMFTILYLSIL